MFTKIPAGFLPDEDQGTLFAIVQLPPGTTQSNTEKVLDQVQHHFLEEQKDAVDAIFTAAQSRGTSLRAMFRRFSRTVTIADPLFAIAS